jgi:hypothetical protein
VDGVRTALLREGSLSQAPGSAWCAGTARRAITRLAPINREKITPATAAARGGASPGIGWRAAEGMALFRVLSAATGCEARLCRSSRSSRYDDCFAEPMD